MTSTLRGRLLVILVPVALAMATPAPAQAQPPQMQQPQQAQASPVCGRLEAQLAAIASFKLVERPSNVPDAKDPNVDSSPVAAEIQEQLVQVGE